MREQNKHKEKSGKHRNDHSIEAKSPFKLPLHNNNNNNKDDLTFRNRTDPQVDGPSPLSRTLGAIPKLLNREDMKLNIEKVGEGPPRRPGVTQIECQLIDGLWELCSRLSNLGNELMREPLGNIQLQIKRMLATIAEQNLCNEAPLASSKKIKLQNCLALSYCDK
jgi:hypothetical protein